MSAANRRARLLLLKPPRPGNRRWFAGLAIAERNDLGTLMDQERRALIETRRR